MFKIKTYLEKLYYDYGNPYIMDNPKERYIDIDDSLKISEIIDHRKFTADCIQEFISIEYNNKSIVNFDVPSGLSLWEDTYLPAIEGYIQNGKVEIMYGIDPILLSLEESNNNEMLLSIYDEWKPNDIYVEEFLPQNEFIESLLDNASHYYEKLMEYKITEDRELRHSSSKDYPVEMLNTILELRKQIKR
ncbi:hypothetical protein [Mangrovibacillus cuniculi]|uniref:Uncharacterized protein n=1 Tax=Mangrovibacillus cuniculi TaxID=2593652 RepID=A0A7S8C9U7_9BACI|nr:hypothetical protein [Mangrovibacillus cuniculi]QPC45853.1 hypothetical protein G8O30_02215 [Mangrovibacillus cuniculi]